MIDWFLDRSRLFQLCWTANPFRRWKLRGEGERLSLSWGLAATEQSREQTSSTAAAALVRLDLFVDLLFALAAIIAAVNNACSCLAFSCTFRFRRMIWHSGGHANEQVLAHAVDEAARRKRR